MNRGLYGGVAAMNSSERGIDAVAANLANLGVNGFKRRATATQSFDALLHGRTERQVGTKSSIDFSQGALRATGNLYDVALSGPGFFAVETPAGERYTRNGQFHIDGEGLLLSLEGFPVAWQGARGTIDVEGPEVQIDQEGAVWQGENKVGNLELANFADPSRLAPEGSGYFRAPAGVRRAAREGDVIHKSLESSNASAVDQMVELIVLQRRFESSARLMATIEQSYKRLTAQR